jgi:NAD(P)-dependent dehydrogenase (short-subunit alcohol dehydrogenase family)
MSTFSIFQALRLDGRTALVTGSSKGIGRSIALALAEAGAGVIVNSRSEDDAARETLDAARGFGVPAHFLPSDLSQPGEGRRLGEAALRLVGQLDIMVSNVAVQCRTPWSAVPADEFELQMRTNFQAAFELIQVTVPPMQARRWGRVLTIGSVQQARPNPVMPAPIADAVFALGRGVDGGSGCHTGGIFVSPKSCFCAMSTGCVVGSAMSTERVAVSAIRRHWSSTDFSTRNRQVILGRAATAAKLGFPASCFARTNNS